MSKVQHSYAYHKAMAQEVVVEQLPPGALAQYKREVDHTKALWEADPDNDFLASCYADRLETWADRVGRSKRYAQEVDRARHFKWYQLHPDKVPKEPKP